MRVIKYYFYVNSVYLISIRNVEISSELFEMMNNCTIFIVIFKYSIK
jgi:hypothetical protein